MSDGDLDYDLDVDPDDYASTAAKDNPTTNDRTHLSDEAFATIKESYVAKHDNGSIHLTLPSHLPPPATKESETKPKLSNKQIQLLSAAAGELYFFKNYRKLLELITWVREAYDVPSSGGSKSRPNGKLEEALGRWEGRCKERIARGEREEEQIQKDGLKENGKVEGN
ncbi:hypothetical protein BDZ85DRAFT_107101 [Elsinoe ampelina]|uniref:Uncharacterized protein n=1 Tax=Elsinoe ampelina TaxID=302913 RepID=A0A6A6GCG8_9PEZI|nr:hypothetical protein BDZ85DRAFT_107101 [Elsinoe ampelina]